MPLMMLDCPACDFDGEVEYTTKRPTHCTPACRAKAYRERKRKRDGKEEQAVTHSEPSRWAGVRYSDGMALVELACPCGRRQYATLLDARELLYRPVRCVECDGDFMEHFGEGG